MKKPNIAIIHYSSPPIIGGVESVLEAQARLFVRNGYYVRIIVSKGKMVQPEIPVSVIPEMDSLYPLNQRIREELRKGQKGEFEKLRRKIKLKLIKELEDINICIVHNLFTMPFNIALTAALNDLVRECRAKRFISWCHDSPFFDPLYQSFLSSINPQEYPWNLLHKPLKDLLYVAISEQRRTQLAKLLKIKEEEIKVIPNGIDIKTFLNLNSETLDVFDKFSLSNPDLIIFMPTRITPRKNIELAIRILSALDQIEIDAKLVITGSPDLHRADGKVYWESLKEVSQELNVEGRVIFLCEIKDDQGRPIKIDLDFLRSLYLMSDMVLITSRQEGFGLPVLEAGLMKLPVFASNISSLKEIGGKEVTYFDLEESPLQIARRIEKFFQQHKGPHLLFKRMIRNYSGELIFKEKIEPLIQNLTASIFLKYKNL
ncbi:MAG: glycosyltransferase family 4 protein [Candidatus Aerophobetes bacterium]|nr:glycosyltransferase family 4 protein [Candidatus Aerophobetes bacterium]